MIKLFVAVNGAILEDWGMDSFPTHARIYQLVNELKKFNDIEISYVRYKQLPRTRITNIIYNNVEKSLAALHSMIKIIKLRPFVYFEYPLSMTIMQNRLIFKICNLLKMKTILDVHDTMEQAEAISNGRSAVSMWMEKDCFKNATLISFSLNPTMWERLAETYKIPDGKKVIFVPNAFEESLIGQNREPYRVEIGRFNVCYIGGLSKNRGIEILVKACLNLHEKYPYLKLLLFGDYGWGISEELKNIIENGGLIKRKMVLRKDLYKVLNEIDLFVMPYNPSVDYMNLCSPTKLFEYIAAGRPIISTKCKSVRESVERGIIYTDYCSQDLEKKIEILIENTELRERLSCELLEQRDSHTWVERAARIHLALNEGLQRSTSSD
jgi:glycosyltransferase involved in cell wall biosynthesis